MPKKCAIVAHVRRVRRRREMIPSSNQQRIPDLPRQTTLRPIDSPAASGPSERALVWPMAESVVTIVVSTAQASVY